MKLTGAYIWTHPDGALCVYTYNLVGELLVGRNISIIDHRYAMCGCNISKWLQENRDETT